MSEKPAKRPRKRQPKVQGLLGVGLDNNDGHKRVTQGEQFVLVGGSEKTHDRMTETMLKTFEELKRRKKPLQTLDPRELSEILDKSDPG